MRSKFYPIIGALIVTSIIASSCSSENKNNTENEGPKFESLDLMTFNLKGPVEHVFTNAIFTNSNGSENNGTMYSQEITFDASNGYSVKSYDMSDFFRRNSYYYNGGDKNYAVYTYSSLYLDHIQRDDQGRLSIVDISEGDGGVYLKFWYGKNQVDSMQWCSSLTRYFYNNSGIEIWRSCETWDCDPDSDGGSSKLDIEYKNTDFDEYGNWTKRLSKAVLDAAGNKTTFYALEERSLTYSHSKTPIEAKNAGKGQTEKIDPLSRFYGKWKNNKVTGANEWINTYFIINRDGSGDIKSTIHSGFGNQPGLDLHFENVIIQGDLLIFCKDGLSYNSCPKLRITGEYASPLETIEGGLVTKQ